SQGGFVEHLIKLNDKVEAGQKVDIQRNSFGEVVAEYTGSVDQMRAGRGTPVGSRWQWGVNLLERKVRIAFVVERREEPPSSRGA
ncbi:MAG: hypothetical protein E5Y69_23585, partial [Mesorhizobium sp.]